MDSLPIELVEKIIRDKVLDYVDLSRLSCVNRRIRDIVDTNDNWMIKFQLAFPDIYHKIITVQHSTSGHDWKSKLKKRCKVGLEVSSEVAELAEKSFTKTELSKSDFSKFDDLMLVDNPENTRKTSLQLFITDELSKILFSTKETDDLTNKYYAEKCITHVKHRMLRPELIVKYQPVHNEYERVMTLIAKWSQPTLDIQDQDISCQLDNIALKILQHLHQSNPDHSIFKKIQEDQHIQNSSETKQFQLPNIEFDKMDNPTKGLWSSKESKQILMSTNHILYSVEGFKGNEDDYYNPYNSYINKVLETKLGIPITLCVVYSVLWPGWVFCVTLSTFLVTFF